jgi:hypothetical protein
LRIKGVSQESKLRGDLTSVSKGDAQPHQGIKPLTKHAMWEPDSTHAHVTQRNFAATVRLQRNLVAGLSQDLAVAPMKREILQAVANALIQER